MTKYEWPVETMMRKQRERANHAAVRKMMQDSDATYPAWKAAFIAARKAGDDVETATRKAQSATE